MKIKSFIQSLTSLILFTFSLTANAQDYTILLATSSPILPAATEVAAASSNEKEVLAQVHSYLKENLSIVPEILQYYNADISLMISFTIDEKGRLADFDSANKRKGSITKSVIKKLKRLKSVEPVIENGAVVSKPYHLNIVFRKA